MLKIYKLFFILFVFAIGPQLFAQESWELAHEDDNVKVWLKEKEGSSYKQFKSETIYNHSLETVTAALMDVESLPDFHHIVYKVDDIEEISPQEGDYNLYFDFPWPVKNRFARIKATIELIEKGHVKVVTKTIASKPISDACLEAQDLLSSWVLKSLPDQKCHVTYYGFLDPGGIIPAWVANLVIVESPVKSLENFEKHVAKYVGKEVAFLNDIEK